MKCGLFCGGLANIGLDINPLESKSLSLDQSGKKKKIKVIKVKNIFEFMVMIYRHHRSIVLENI